MNINTFNRMFLSLTIIVCFNCKYVKNNTSEKTPIPVKKQENKTLISYWNTQKKGTNYFNEIPTREWFKSVADANIKLVRFTYEKWKGEQKDFLLGSADDYKGLVDNDFQKLKKYLDIANEFDIKVVLTPLSLPGARYVQTNGGKKDGRLWTESKYLIQAVQFWKDLAVRLKGHPALVGYNLINEPFPEWFNGKKTFWNKGFKSWCEKVKGKTGDLNLFNKKMIEGIRTVNSEIPIVVESGLYGTPWAFECLEPINDNKVIYSFHMYEPYEFTTKSINQEKYNYPGEIPIPDLNNKCFVMNKQELHNFLNPVINWAKQHNIASNRIWVGEFGCDRETRGATEYLTDLIDIFNEQQWHWAFYSYREDVWSSMDYELGTGKIFWKYWDYKEAGSLHKHYDEVYGNVKVNSIWDKFKSEFK